MDDNIDLPIGVLFVESAILCATPVLSPGNYIGELLNNCFRILFNEKLLKLPDLSFVVLAVG